MRNNFLKSLTAFAVLSISFALAFSSCKENTVLPSDLVPAVDNINTFQTDTFTLITRSVYDDSVLTGGSLNGESKSASTSFYHAIGTVLNDNVYGKTIASSYFQIVPAAPQFKFSGSNQIIDSLVLAVLYVDMFGDSVSSPLQTFNLYRTSDNLSLDSAYFPFSKVNYSASDLLTSKTINFNTFRTDTVYIGASALKPQVRFQLPSSFYTELLSKANNDDFQSYTDFINWLGGFYIQPDSTVGKALGYWDTYNATMYAYYRYPNGSSGEDTALATFKFNPIYCNRFNAFSKNYTASQSAPYINTSNALGDEINFIETEPGLATEITFPSLSSLPNSIINKAELILTVQSPFTNYSDTSSFNIANRMQVSYIGTDGKEYVLEDYANFDAQLGFGWVGGYRKLYEIASSNRIQYKFVITHTIQKAISSGVTDFKLHITGLRSALPGKSRVLVAGGKNTNTLEKAKLNIIFTKIK